MKPAIVVLGIFTFMFQWVNFLWPLAITTTDNMKTLTVGIASLQGQFVTNWGLISAAAVMTMVPITIVFLLFQKLVRAGIDGGRAQAVTPARGDKGAMAEILIKHLVKRFGKVEAVSDVSLQVADGEFLVLLGPSGCGKSTILRVVAGLENADSGEIVIGDKLVNFIDPVKRNVAMVFQNYALYPHMTVAKNIAFPLEIAKKPKDEINAAITRAAGILGLEELLERLPGQLSGGQRQRVALARAIVREPQAFLMDEPLSNLDAQLRIQTRLELIQLHAAARDHDHVRHARPGRGDDDGPPDRRDEPRRPAADRHAAGRLPPAGQRVRRDVPRGAADEHDRRRARVGRRRLALPRRRTSTCRSRPTC